MQNAKRPARADNPRLFEVAVEGNYMYYWGWLYILLRRNICFSASSKQSRQDPLRKVNFAQDCFLSPPTTSHQH